LLHGGLLVPMLPEPSFTQTMSTGAGLASAFARIAPQSAAAPAAPPPAASLSALGCTGVEMSGEIAAAASCLRPVAAHGGCARRMP